MARSVMLIKEGIIIRKIQAGKNTDNNCEPSRIAFNCDSLKDKERRLSLILLPAKANLTNGPEIKEIIYCNRKRKPQ